MRLAHIAGSSTNPSHFTVLVRAIPRSSEESYSDSVKKFFTKYHASSYLSHQMVYRCGRVQKLMVHICLKLTICCLYSATHFLKSFACLSIDFLMAYQVITVCFTHA